MRTFSQSTLQDWKTRGITDVSCFLISGGCAGEKAFVQEGTHNETDFVQTENGIRFHMKHAELDFFKKTRLTKVDDVWIATNKDDLVGHCSCGSSFRRKTGNPILDKAEQIRLRLKQKTKHHK